MGHQVFVSHSYKDKIAADAIVAHLEHNGIRCWVAPRDILPGASWASAILKGISESKLMVLVFSDNANTSEHVRSEVERAIFHGIPVAPVRIKDVIPLGDLEFFLSRAHWMDAMTPPFERHLEQLAEKLKLLMAFPVVPKIDQPMAPALAAPTKWKKMRVAIVVTAALVGAISVMLAVYGLRGPSKKSGNQIASTSPSGPLKLPQVDVMPRKIGETYSKSIGMKFEFVPAGDFLMGSPLGETGRFDFESQHKVTLSKKFMLQTTTVTQAQWKAVMGNNPSNFQGDELPVEEVRWNEAIDFCEKLGHKEAKHYCLPTEAEWEYACRAGTTTTYNTGDSKKALVDAGWYDGNSGNTTHPVGQKKPNAWGLYDMHGNVYQWCSDWYAKYPDGDATGPARFRRG